MNTLVDRLAEQPRNRRSLVGIGGLVTVAAAMWQFVVSPPLDEYQSLSATIAKNDQDILVEQKVASRLEVQKVSLSNLEARLREARAKLADKSQVDDLLHNISASAQEAGLDLKLFQRKEESVGKFYAEIPVAVSVSGAFHDVATFFDTVNHLPGLVTVDRISFSSPKETEERIVVHVDFVVTAHRLLTEHEREQRPDPKKK
jgi:Tfp pilus assembly protein PilO